MDVLKEVIETKLNIKLNDIIKYQISNLNEIEDAYIENARILEHEYEAEYYLGMLVTDDNLRYLKGFVRSVITDKEDHRSWGIGVVLVLNRSLDDVLTIERDALFNQTDDQFKQILPPDFEAWKQHSDFGGGFAFYKPEATYKFTCPVGYLMMSPKLDKLIDVSPTKVSLQFRRWQASNIAAYLDDFNQLNKEADLSILEEISPKDNWTEDALMALNGLLKELALGVSNEKITPGFYGPDHFYFSE